MQASYTSSVSLWLDTCLAAARSHSGENNTQLFSKTLVPLRYLKGKAYRFVTLCLCPLCGGYPKGFP